VIGKPYGIREPLFGDWLWKGLCSPAKRRPKNNYVTIQDGGFPGQILSAIPTVPLVAICNQSGQTPSSAGNRIIARKFNLVGSPDHCPFKRAVQPVINVSGEEVLEGNELIRKRPSGATAY